MDTSTSGSSLTPDNAATRSPGPGRSLAGGVSLLTLAAVLLPIVENWRRPPKDSFPLSYYPMFAAKRGATARCTYLIGSDAAGGRHCLPYELIGPGGLNQIRRQLRQIAKRGHGPAVCATVAARVAHSQPGPGPDLVSIQLVTGEYSLTSYCAGRREPLRERIVADAVVPRVTR